MKPGKEARALVDRASALVDAMAATLAAPSTRRRDARQAFEAVRDEIVQRQLAIMPLSRLRETTPGQVRFGLVEAAGFKTVGAAAAAGAYRLQQIPGVGPQTAKQVIAAAHQLAALMADSVRVRFDPDLRPEQQGHLLRALRAYEITHKEVSEVRGRIEEMKPRLEHLIGPAQRARSRFRLLFASRKHHAEWLAALHELDGLLGSTESIALESDLPGVLKRTGRPAPDVGALWKDYAKRAVAYNGLLIETAGQGPDLNAVQGFIPEDIAKRVQQQPLDMTRLEVSLRGYQAFGAKFALAQGKAILGDEMGLGKTIEALAALCHLWTEGESHFLVVCPASVIVNWAHETERHSQLAAFLLHGADRVRNVNAWARRGGVAITTFGSLRTLDKPEGVEISMLVVDEAHFIKNPAALRTKAVRQWIPLSNRTLFLTGTPMENRVEEFRTLVDHLRPDVAAGISAMGGLAGALAFRRAVSPVYLRRNQSDVLDELPPLIENEDWVQFGEADLSSYVEAVASGNFMAMRQAAYVGDTVRSAKLVRLAQIVDESSANGHKIVVFSFFREVLKSVASVVGGITVGPLTGSVSPPERQAMVDEFTSRPEPAVLVSQIDAGGVGLNIQAASVVILTEPQWKRTTEDQAVARCHRMGQVRPVSVHRLLAENSVDQRMLEVLASKQLLFDEYVRRSELKDATPDAVDVSDIRKSKEVVTQAEAERRIVEMERKRLGVTDVVETGSPSE